LAFGVAIFFFAGALILQYRTPSVVIPKSGIVDIVPGSAVGDLQMLGEIEDASDAFALLDELAPESQPVANRN
jgi:hypothetical protein